MLSQAHAQHAGDGEQFAVGREVGQADLCLQREGLRLAAPLSVGCRGEGVAVGPQLDIAPAL